MMLTFGFSTFSRGDTTNTNLQNMEPVSETDQEQIPEDLGKLTVVDKAHTGRVSLTRASPDKDAVTNFIILLIRSNDYLYVQGVVSENYLPTLPVPLRSLLIYSCPSLVVLVF